jgi:lactoylglutathione lyase
MEIDYIALFVADVDRSVAFYRDTLGFQFDKPVKNKGTEGLSGKLKIGIYDRMWLSKLFGDRYLQTVSGNTFLLSMTVDDLDTTYKHLQSLDAKITGEPTIMPWGQRLMFLEDPDGNLLEIVQKIA